MNFSKISWTYKRFSESYEDNKNISGTATSTVVSNIFWINNQRLPTPSELVEIEKASFQGHRLKDLLEDGNSTIGKKEVSIYNDSGVLVDEISNLGTYMAVYKFTSYSDTVTVYYDINMSLTYTFSVIQNQLPLKKWTVTDAINRCTDLIEPLVTTATESKNNGVKKIENISSNTPRFRLQGVNYGSDGNIAGYDEYSTAWLYDRVLAPEFTLTKMTLREQLQQIGGFIHGEPRAKGVYPTNGTKPFFDIYFDWYGSDIRAKISEKNPISLQLKQDVNEYCTGLDSQVENLVNQLDYAQGVVVEPFASGYKTLRSETTTTRYSEDDNTFISTELPIYKIGEKKQVFCMYIPGVGDNDGKGWDITPYIFEKADYQNLSSYDGIYPYSKAYALYYTQGQPNIKGLFYKVPNAVNASLENYAIINILKEVTGKSLSVTGQNLMALSFRVTYLPMSSVRIKTNKSVVLGGLPSTLVYNQNANVVESRYYGENLKGVVARLGNIEKTYTYKVAFLSEVPKAGQLFDDEYYISAVSVEYQPYYIKVTVGLSKDFNRLSEYVGINSNKRMWEVSEKQSQSRERTIVEYVMISDDSIKSDTNTYFKGIREIFNGSTKTLGIVPVLFGSEDAINTIDRAVCTQFNKQGTQVGQEVVRPVVSSAFGNSIHFSFRMEDNYSAGQQSDYVKEYATSGNSKVSGYWGNYTPYCDYYGRYYYWRVKYLNTNDGVSITDTDGKIDNGSLPFQYPQNVIGDSYNPVIDILTKYRKDSREIPSDAYQITAVTDKSKYIIGSGLMKNSGLVNKNPKEVKVYVFKDRLNTIDSKVDFSALDAEEYYELTDDDTRDGTVFSIDNTSISLRQLTQSAYNKIREYKAWAFITKPTQAKINVEDEDGKQTTQTIYEGGEIVLGKNAPYPATHLKSSPIYFAVKRSVYD